MKRLTINIAAENTDLIGTALDEISERLNENYKQCSVKQDGCEFSFTVQEYDEPKEKA